MTVKKTKKGTWGLYHCTGHLKGKLIHEFKTQKEALAMHRAIQISKRGRKGDGKMQYGVPKMDGSGRGRRANRLRNPACRR